MRNSTLARVSRLSAIGLFSLGLASAVSAEDSSDWLMHDVTVLTVASHGAWGTATREYTSAAIAAAIADCRRRAVETGGTGSGCGARQVYARNGWLLAYACGGRMFAVSGRTLQEARSAAVIQETDWREVYRLDIPACSLAVAIGPDGKPAAPDVANEVLPAISGLSHAR